MKIYRKTIILIVLIFLNSCSKKNDPSKQAIGTVTTIAGSGAQASNDGLGTKASITAPRGITLDAAGNVYVTDAGLNQIRKISPAGDVTTLPDNGPGSTDIYSGPFGLAIDATGNLFVSYFFSAAIKKITRDGNSSVIEQYTGVPANGLQQPLGLAVDASDNLYVAGYSSCSIVKISYYGATSIYAGGRQGSEDGLDADAGFNLPNGIAIDSDGNIYVADSGNNEVRKISTSGNVTTMAGSGVAGAANGTGKNATFNYPSGVAVDKQGNVYVADTNNNLIRKISPSGVVSTLAGSGAIGSQNGIGTSASFFYPFDLAMGPDGNLYVADTHNNLVRKITLN